MRFFLFRRLSRSGLRFGFRGKVILTVLAAVLLAAGGSVLKHKLTMRPGTVLSVADCDTAVIANGAGKSTKVRLFGIDAPEYHQTAGREAAAFARKLLLGKRVTFSVHDTDKYGRSVAVITLADGTNVNETMVKNGHAWVYRSFCKEVYCAAWLYYEHQAKSRKLGLWNEKKPQPPWEWRQQNPRR